MNPIPDEGSERVIRGGDRVLIRPLHARDAELERHFIEHLSPVSRRFRFLDSMTTPGDDLLRQLTVLDPATDVAYVAVVVVGSTEVPVGVGRLSAGAHPLDCEFAVTVADAWQNKGLGTLLMQHLIDEAHRRGIETLHSSDARDNDLMRRFAAHLGLRHQSDPEDTSQVLYSLDVKRRRDAAVQPLASLLRP